MAKPRAKRARKAGARRLKAIQRSARAIVVGLAMVVLFAPPVWVLVYRFIPPPMTFLMIERMSEGYGLHRQWRNLARISPAVTRAAIASEDARFCEHHGFDIQAIRGALEHDERHHGRLRGGSTISQQTAKNVFLWPARSWVRKGIEAWFTVLIEALWGKRRVMEVYLNTVEMGPGVYGVQAAARRDFGVDADDLTPAQASRLVAILPSPLKWSAVDPGPYVRRRTGRIDARQSNVRAAGMADCVLRPPDRSDRPRAGST